jgi:hypothetical protein
MQTYYGCKHRPERLYASVVPIVHNLPGKLLVVTCCDCGETWEKPFSRRQALDPFAIVEQAA